MSNQAKILVVEDDFELREAVVDTLELANFNVEQVDSAEQAMEICGAQHFDMVISDVNMGQMDGHQLLTELDQQYPLMPVVLMTAFGSIERSVAAMQVGAKDYLVKPFEPQVLVDCVKRYVSTPADETKNDGPIVVQAESQQLYNLASRVAKVDSTVLICGESGTGKEVLAQYIHDQSRRHSGPFVAINCAAIPDNLLESELFGYEKGAFTGAAKQTPGKIELADGGTLFLDEIGDLPFELQAKLLRFLQEREIERVGGRVEIPIDVRIICATHQNLMEHIAQGKFREDLYYRISEITIEIPPLKDREGDSLILAKAFLDRFNRDYSKALRGFDKEALSAIESYDWPGNVREIESKLKRAVIMAEGTQITLNDLQLKQNCQQPLPLNLKQVREHAERKAIQRALSHTDNNVSEAAKELGVTRPTLYSLFEKYGLKSAK